jgi:TonB-linked SusC/RagA family outer membrane protein
VPPYDETGNWSYTPLGNTPNPVGMVELLHNDNQSYSTKATVFAIVEPIKGLRYETRLSGTLGFGDSYNFMPVYFITPSNKNSNSRISRNSSSGYDWLWQNTLSYNRSLFDDHNISIMGGMESGYGKSSWMGAERLDLINESENMWYFNASTNGTNLSQLPQGSASESSGYSYFGRLSYDYKGIFLLQGNVRKDYSSRFGPRNRSGVFPSYSAGFKFTELDVVKKSLPFLDFGKIRYGWGKVGNNAIPEYVYFSTVALLDVLKYPFSNDATSSQGAGRDRAVNTSVAWEGVVTRNIGVDLGFLNNRLTITTDFFKRFNEGMLMEVPPPLMGGWIIRTAYWENNNVSSNPIANVGRIGNSGIEFSGTWKETRGKFKYGVDANFSWIKTLVDEITPDTLYRGTAKGLGGFLTETIQGNAIGEYYGYKTNGLFRPSDADTINGKVVVTNQPYTIAADGTTKVYAQAKAKPGDFRFIDANNDGKINNKDAVPLGNPNPKFLFGLNLNLEYNGIDFSMFWQGVAGNKIFNAVKFYQFNTDGGFNWSADYVENHYREALYNRAGKLMFEANPDGKYPRLDPKNDNNNFSTVSDFYIEDGSYLRLKNMQLGYTFPNRWTSKAGISRFRIYFSANNLLTLTKYTGYDPEVGSTDILVQGLDRGAYPTAKLYLMGINLNF